MRDRDDFIKTLQDANVSLLILTKDIKYPLSEERQKWLDGAQLLIGHLVAMEMQDDIAAVLQNIGKQQQEETPDA